MAYLNLDSHDLAYMEEFDKELEEAYDTARPDEPDVSDHDQNFNNRSLLDIVFFAFFSLSLPAIIALCHGIFLQVYVMRSIFLLLSRLLEITATACQFLLTARFFAVPEAENVKEGVVTPSQLIDVIVTYSLSLLG